MIDWLIDWLIASIAHKIQKSLEKRKVWYDLWQFCILMNYYTQKKSSSFHDALKTGRIIMLW